MRHATDSAAADAGSVNHRLGHHHLAPLRSEPVRQPRDKLRHAGVGRDEAMLYM